MMADWREQAACKGMDTNLFFPTINTTRLERKEAMATCQRCEVSQECLDYALSFEAHNQFGIFGGTTDRERIYYQRHVLLTRKETRHGFEQLRNSS